MLFWFIIFSVVLVLSFLLAIRSMRNAEMKIKGTALSQSLYLVRYPEGINQEILEKLHQTLVTKKASVSIERLYKGTQQAMAIYGPQILPDTFPELNLLELEDYLVPREETFTSKNPHKVNADQAFVWTVPIEPTMSSKALHEDLNLNEEEQFFYQLILQPLIQKEENYFKITARAMAASKDKLDKVKLAKRMFNQLNSKLGIETDKLISSPRAFEKYQYRMMEGNKSFTLSETFKALGI